MERRPLVIINGKIQELPLNSWIPTISEEDAVYSKRVDFISDNLLYRAEAAVGSLTNSPVWRIRRISFGNDGDVTETWANASSAFVHVWDNRLSYTYS
jgi:hypothetical protein